MYWVLSGKQKFKLTKDTYHIEPQWSAEYMWNLSEKIKQQKQPCHAYLSTVSPQVSKDPTIAKKNFKKNQLLLLQL